MLFLRLHVEWFRIYPQVKQAPHLCLCRCTGEVVLAVIAKVMGLGRVLNGKEFARELCKYVHF